MRDRWLLEDVRAWTGDPLRPTARAILIEGDRIAALDPSPVEIGDARRVDGGGRFAMPGFVDAHLHLLLGGARLLSLDLGGVRDRADFEARIAAAHATMPPDRWLVAYGWNEERWAERTPPDARWLRAAGARPCVCWREDIHVALVNEPVLRRLDLRDDPPGGSIGRDADGAPNGLLFEAAAWHRLQPIVPPPTTSEKAEALRAAEAHLLAHGVTSVGAMEYAADVESVLGPRRDDLRVRCHVTLLDRDWPLDAKLAARMPAGRRLRVVGFKAFADGTLGSRTARLLAPYADAPATRGLLVELAERGVLRDWARLVADAGLQPAIHAIGDEAARLALDALDGLPDGVRARVEHAQQLDRADLPHFAGRIASVQPLHRAYDGPWLEDRLGSARLAQSFPLFALRAAGAILAFGSDWPVVPCDPRATIEAATGGRCIDGTAMPGWRPIDGDAALRAHTRAAAFALHLDEAGVLAPGWCADLVVLDADPRVDPEARVHATVVDGRLEHGAW